MEDGRYTCRRTDDGRGPKGGNGGVKDGLREGTAGESWSQFDSGNRPFGRTFGWTDEEDGVQGNDRVGGRTCTINDPSGREGDQRPVSSGGTGVLRS